MAKKRILSILLNVGLGCLISLLIVNSYGNEVTAKLTNGQPASEILIGTFEDDGISGEGGDDRIYGNPQPFYAPPADYTIQSLPKPSEFGGHDIINGDSAKNSTIAGNDTIIVGYESSPYSTTRYDDEVHGGPGNDILSGIWNERDDYVVRPGTIRDSKNNLITTLIPEIQTGWHDDYDGDITNEVVNDFQFALGKLRRDIQKNALDKNSKKSTVPQVKGDNFKGDSGLNTYILGYGDTWPMRQGDPTASVWYLSNTRTGKIINIADSYDIPYKIAAPLDENITDPNAYPGVPANQTFGLSTGIVPNGTNAFTLAEFTRGGDNTSLLFNKDGIGQLVGARTPDFLNYAPIASNKNGDFILRFTQGTILVSAQGQVIFGISENGEAIQNGDSGIKVPVISGYENHTNDYFIDSDQWARDALTEINKQKSPDTAQLIWNANNTLLRSVIYPVIDQYGKVVSDGEPLNYTIVNFDGTVNTFSFDDYGIEAPPAPPNPNSRKKKPGQPMA
ncbi:hypothetical protein HW132_32180 [Brasilonema sp. CT11]|nr:hypothetical protein [Brasilonema sp. CT11]